jgi:mersacidin/lichenicidin family type 2 lantibiotic
MTDRNIIRAWKDQENRLSLSEAERASLPHHPAGAIELSDELLDDAAGGAVTATFASIFLHPPTEVAQRL